MEIKKKIQTITKNTKNKINSLEKCEKLFLYFLILSLFNSLTTLIFSSSQYKTLNLIFLTPYSTIIYFIIFTINIYLIYLYLNKQFKITYSILTVFIILNSISSFYKLYLKIHFFKILSSANQIVNKFFNIGLTLMIFNLLIIISILYLMYNKKYTKTTKLLLTFFLALNILISSLSYYSIIQDYNELQNAYKQIKTSKNPKLSFISCRNICSRLESTCFQTIPSKIGIKNLNYHDYKTSDIELDYTNKQQLIFGIAHFNKNITTCNQLEKKSSQLYCKKIISGNKNYCNQINDTIKKRICKNSFTHYTKQTLCKHLNLNSEKGKKDCFERIKLYI